jgi:hypothetical protein
MDKIAITPREKPLRDVESLRGLGRQCRLAMDLVGNDAQKDVFRRYAEDMEKKANALAKAGDQGQCVGVLAKPKR